MRVFLVFLIFFPFYQIHAGPLMSELGCGDCVDPQDRNQTKDLAKTIKEIDDFQRSIGALVFKGSVIVRRQGVPMRIDSPFPLLVDDEVIVGAKAKARILLKDKTMIDMVGNSHLVVDEYVYKPGGTIDVVKGVLRFISGIVTMDVPSGSGRDNDIRVRTDSAAITVRGTRFSVGITKKNGKEFVAVKTFAGKVELTNLATKKRIAVAAGSQVSLSAGKFSKLTSSDPSRVPARHER